MENNLIGYAQDRANIMGVKQQIKALIEYGVPKYRIYTREHGIDEAVKSCDRGGDILVMYSAVIIGLHAYPKFIKRMAAQDAKLYILRKKLLIDCAAGEGVADGALDIKQYNEQLGKLYGRKKKYSVEDVGSIIKYVVQEGNTQKEAAKYFHINETIVSRMVNGIYFKTTRGSK